MAIDEMRPVAALALPRATFTETVGALQLVAIAGGAAIGYLSGRRRQRLASTRDTWRP